VRIRFVGMNRPYRTMMDDRVRLTFDQYHLELPYYYARFGGNDVRIETVDDESVIQTFSSGGSLARRVKGDGRTSVDDVVVHWRAWHEGSYQPHAVNVMHTCDHSYPSEWVRSVQAAFSQGKLHAVMCHPTWHRENTFRELQGVVPLDRLWDGITSGVDTDVFDPEEKDPFQMLWASDPGRGIAGAAELAVDLHRRDRRFRLHVCQPDYSPRVSISHPAIVVHGFVPNGPELWDLFNTSSFFPYTSTFPEPSSRAYRQAQSSGCVVLYPPGMGSPSSIIRDGVDGLVVSSSQMRTAIEELVSDAGAFKAISQAARDYALSESWRVQARRFNERLIPALQEKRR